MLSAYLRTAPHPVQENDQWCATGRMAEARRHFALRSRPLGAFPSQVLNSKSACLHTGLAHKCAWPRPQAVRRVHRRRDSGPGILLITAIAKHQSTTQHRIVLISEFDQTQSSRTKMDTRSTGVFYVEIRS